MATNEELEQRIAVLEEEIRQLRALMPLAQKLDNISGSLAGLKQNLDDRFAQMHIQIDRLADQTSTGFVVLAQARKDDREAIITSVGSVMQSIVESLPTVIRAEIASLKPH